MQDFLQGRSQRLMQIVIVPPSPPPPPEQVPVLASHVSPVGQPGTPFVQPSLLGMQVVPHSFCPLSQPPPPEQVP